MRIPLKKSIPVEFRSLGDQMKAIIQEDRTQQLKITLGLVKKLDIYVPHELKEINLTQ